MKVSRNLAGFRAASTLPLALAGLVAEEARSHRGAIQHGRDIRWACLATPTRAGRLMLELIAEHVARGENFAFETTLAGRNFARAIEQWRAAGYHVSLIFLSMQLAPCAGSCTRRLYGS